MFRIKQSLRSNDFDLYGHLNHSAYHVLFEQARVAYVFSRLAADFHFVLVRVELDHLREVRVGEREVEIGIATERVGRSSFVLAQSMWRADGQLSAQGDATFAAWDPQRRQSRPLTDGERSALLAPASDG